MQRPMPPAPLVELSEFSGFGIRLTPAPEVWEWLQAEILADTGSIHMWASSSFEKQGRIVLGQAEQVAFRAGGWQKARMEQQMRDWFGDVPAFIITLAADYCAECSDADFCALIEHELYHIAQATDKYGQPAFTQEGAPKLKLRGHDVEEFVGVVRRYGAGQRNSGLLPVASAAACGVSGRGNRACPGQVVPGGRIDRGAVRRAAAGSQLCAIDIGSDEGT
ncbi:MAG: putative metallopeptidase [Pseudomonadales bacterium]